MIESKLLIKKLSTIRTILFVLICTIGGIFVFTIFAGVISEGFRYDILSVRMFNFTIVLAIYFIANHVITLFERYIEKTNHNV